jgi:ribosomal protein S18 acetylase RimI-like enzyme
VRPRVLAPHELARIGEIDRSEHVHAVYVLEQGSLQLVERELEIASWNADELAETRARLDAALAEGGAAVGVVDDDRLAAAAVLGGALLEGDRERLELVFLHVSRSHRRRGLGRALFHEVCELARSRGACELYVSSSDVAAAVDLYRALGCVLADPVDTAAVARWPDDIQLMRPLG